MEITTDLLKHILDKKGQDAKAIAEEIQKYCKINVSIKNCRENKEIARKEFEYKIKLINDTIQRHQMTCDHPVFNFNGDPSGNGDSFHQCLICDKEF